MNPWMAWFRGVLREYRLRKRFPSSVIYSGAVADQGSALGEYSVLFEDVKLVNTSLGAYSYVQSSSTIYNSEIGPFCSIASNVAIGLGAHPTSMVSISPVFYDNEQPLPRFFTKHRQFTETLPKTTIGPDVWIGQGVMVKAGVSIGVGAVIGAGAVVTKDVPPYMIAAGNPCRPIRSRFNDETCKKLIESQWWKFDEARLQELANYFQEPEEFCQKIEADGIPDGSV